MISRRGFLRMLTGLLAIGATTSAYGIVIEPMFRLRVRKYALTPRNWSRDLRLRIAVLTDIHCCEPWMSAARVQKIVAVANELEADCFMLLGDYVTQHRFRSGDVPPDDWARALAGLRAPLGIHAVLGNHDWWDDIVARRRGYGPTISGRALTDAGIPVYENDVVRLAKDGKPFWIAGLGDQWAFGSSRRGRARQGVDDLPGTLAKITDDAPVIMMAHEPDIFAEMSPRVSLTVSGHTHGGQVTLFGKAFTIPSKFGDRYLYGHIVEPQGDLIVSSGIGCTGIPVRFGVPPEIVVIDLGGAPQDERRYRS